MRRGSSKGDVSGKCCRKGLLMSDGGLAEQTKRRPSPLDIPIRGVEQGDLAVLVGDIQAVK